MTTISSRRGARPALTVALTAVAFFMVVLDSLVVVTALPSIHRALGGGLATLQWAVNAYSIASAAGIITAAALGDRLGRRRVYVIGLTVFTVGSALSALAPGIGLLIAARAVQGLAAALIIPLSLTILSASFPPEKRGTVTGLWGGVSGLGVAAGPLIGGAVTQGLSWHWIFWVNVPFGVAALIGARIFLPESHGPRTRLDLPGLAGVSAGIAALIWGLVQGPQDGWTSVPVLAALMLGSGLLGGFLAWEARASAPMIPLGLFQAKGFSAAVAVSFLVGAGLFSAVFLTSQFFQLALHYSPLGTGLRFLPWTVTPLLVAPLAGALSDRTGPRVLIVPGLLMQAGGLAWIVALAGSAKGYPYYLAAFLVAGTGVSLTLPTAATAALNALPPVSLGKASAVYNSLRSFGYVTGIALVTAIFNANGGLATPAAVTSGYRPALAASAGLSAAGVIVGLAVGRRERTTPQSAGTADPAYADSGPSPRRPGTSASPDNEYA